MATRNEIVQLYLGYFNRAPDPIGFNFWLGEAARGVELLEIADSFANSPEAQSIYPSLLFPELVEPTEFVEAAFDNLFNREVDQEGLDFYVAGIQGGRSYGEILLDIINGAQGDDATIIDNKVLVGDDYVSSVASIPGFEYDDRAASVASNVVAGVGVEQSSVNEALQDIDDFVEEVESGGGPAATSSLTTENDNVTGTGGDDLIRAEDGELNSGDVIDGAGGNDTLQVFSETSAIDEGPVSPTVTNVEEFVVTNQTNDLISRADNNVGGFGVIDGTTMVDVEVDAGRMRGVTRWEDYDSRADLVIEDARDDDDSDGTYTKNVSIAMVSTDPGNVDYAVYFDDPTNRQENVDSIFVELIDQNNSIAYTAADISANTPGNLTDAQLIQFTFVYNGEEVTVELDPEVVGEDFFGEDATYNDLVDAINAALAVTTLEDGTVVGNDVTASIDGTFAENIGNDNPGEGTNDEVFGLRIELSSASRAELADAGGADILVAQLNDPADTAQAVTAERVVDVELTTLQVVLDDVGKGSTGGDLLAGAMSTGRQFGDDRTSDSPGIQRFEIDVDNTSNLQTINSTNNTLEEVVIESVDNATARGDSDEEADGDLIVRGQANPDSDVITDGFMPGAAPQHNQFGFSDVRLIDASTGMNGIVDITAELTAETVEKYLDKQDTDADQDNDDVNFSFSLSNADKEGEDDEFFLEMSPEALADAGTGSREDFILDIDGNDGDDAITTVVGNTSKKIDAQGQDFYDLDDTFFGRDDADPLGGTSPNGIPDWYDNHNDAGGTSELNVDGGNGDDEIWTFGYGDYVIGGGAGDDVIFSDNSGVVENGDVVDTFIDRQVGEHRQSDYFLGAVWTFNDGSAGDGIFSNIVSGGNDELFEAAEAASDRDYRVTVSYNVQNVAAGVEPNANPETAFTSTVELNLDAGESFREADLNQAIKEAINDNAKLSAVLEAQDGPGNSLVVYSKLDGEFQSIDNLSVEVTELDENGDVASTEATVTPDDFENFGSDSSALQESVITPGSGDDVVALSTNAGVSQEINFGDAFGADTLYHFEAGDGGDLLDFTSFRPTDDDGDPIAATVSTGAFSSTDGSVSIVEEDEDNDELAEVADEYDGSDDGDLFLAIIYDTATDNNADEGAHVEGNNNTGTVYLIEGGDSASATELGSVDLIGVDWESLTPENFNTGA